MDKEIKTIEVNKEYNTLEVEVRDIKTGEYYLYYFPGSVIDFDKYEGEIYKFNSNLRIYEPLS